MVRFDVRNNAAEIAARFERAAQQDIERARVAAINRAVTTVRAEASRRLAPAYPGLRASKLKARITFKRASRAAPTAVITFSNRRFGLWAQFNVRTRNTRYGTGVAPGARLPEVLVSGANVTLTEAQRGRIFLARSRNHNRPNFWTRQGPQRMPIDVVLVPALASTYRARGLEAQLTTVAAKRFATVFAQQLKFRTGG